MVVKKILITSKAVVEVYIGWKYTLLVRQFINTIMVSCPCLVKDNCIMKSIIISFHLLLDVNRDCKRLAGL